MPSLVKKMFETMPLYGVLGAARQIVGAGRFVTLGQVKRFVRSVGGSPPVYTAQPAAPSAGTPANDAALWGWRTTGDPSFVEEVTCRVRDMDFAACLVLERLDFGYAPKKTPKDFRPSVLVVLNGKEVELPLSKKYHLVSFLTDRGYIHPDKNAALWPLESYHDESLLHVFVYDVDRVTGALRVLKSPEHPDATKVREMMANLDKLDKAAPDDARNAGEILFTDDLWDPPPANTPPTGTVPENVDLSLKAVRVMVACSMTTCRERDDYQPGKLGGVARLYPHIMVVSTSALDRVEAGVHFRRSTITQMRDHGSAPNGHHHMHSAGEMLPDIKTLLVADSNVGNMVMHNMLEHKVYGQTVPIPYWANLFTYYVADPLKDTRVGDKLLPVVRRSKNLVRNDVGNVSRDCKDLKGLEGETILPGPTNDLRVVKLSRQGYFDNIHVAPRMKVGASVAKVVIANLTGMNTEIRPTLTDIEAWKMNEVAMAPFCAHDCFHMHWRWSDNANIEVATWGWGHGKPYDAVGQVMVPDNQDVFLQVLGNAEFSYLAHAHSAPKDVWQPFCHHGTGYAVHVGDTMDLARTSAPGADRMRFYDANDNRVDDKSWALFYWRLRYRLVGTGKSYAGRYLSVALEERFSFLDEASALDL